MKHPEHEMTDSERAIINDISKSVSPIFTGLAMKFMLQFMLQCRDANFHPKVAASSFALCMVANIIKLCLKTSRVPSEVMPDEAVMEIAFEVHRKMMTLCGDFVVQKNKENAAPFN